MRVLILSDLHVELASFSAPQRGFDLVILAGDIHNGVPALQWGRQTFPDHPIVQIAGNHEFYDHDYQPCLDAMRAAAQRLDIRFLENDRVVIDGVEFLGCTLWTDFRIFEAPGRPLLLDAAGAMQANLRLIADYHAIEIGSGAGARRFMPADSAVLFEQSQRWLAQALSQPRPMPRVVVTHHLPSWRSVAPGFERAVTNAAFVSDLEFMLGQSDVWIHGHTHTSHRYEIAGTRVICNPRGYPNRRIPGEFENPGFMPDLVVEV